MRSARAPIDGYRPWLAGPAGRLIYGSHYACLATGRNSDCVPAPLDHGEGCRRGPQPRRESESCPPLGSRSSALDCTDHDQSLVLHPSRNDRKQRPMRRSLNQQVEPMDALMMSARCVMRIQRYSRNALAEGRRFTTSLRLPFLVISESRRYEWYEAIALSVSLLTI